MWKLVAAIAAVFALTACGFSTEVPPDGPGPSVTVGFEKPTSVVDRKTGVHQIRVKLSEITTRDVTVSYQVTGGTAIPPTDFDLITQETITIPAGEQYAFFEVRINPISDADRPDQTIDITLLNPKGASIGLDKHEVTILAKALPRVSFETDASTAQEPTDEVMILKLDEPSEFDITVDYTVTPMGAYTVGGSDYMLANGTVTFPKGTTTQSIALDVLQDALDEDPESVQIVLENPTKAFIDMTKDRHTHTITDDDPLPAISIQANQTVGEAAGAITVGVTLTPVSGRPVSVPYALVAGSTATSGTDFTVTGTTLTINPGTTTASIPVTIIQDTIDEPTESFQIDLGMVVNATVSSGSHVVSITDDDLVCYGAAPFSVCFDSPPTGNLTISTNINTSPGGSNLCASTQPTGWTTAPQSQDAACVVARDTITINAGSTIAVTGSRPLVLVAATSITIDGVVDASSNSTSGATGAAAPSGACAAFLQNPAGSATGGGGGAGATFVTIGGAGGTGDGGNATQAGTPPPAETTPLAKLRAGCNGQRGGNGGGSNPSGNVGRGGGAVYIVTGGTLTLGATSILHANGSGAAGGGSFSGGSGAGSGGMIKLFATTLTATTGAKIVANGGGGASGADNNASNDGNDPNPTTPSTPAAGGSASGAGAAGGAGYAGGVAAVMGGNAGGNKGGGGGGGGGGYVQSNNMLTNVTVSAGVIQIP